MTDGECRTPERAGNKAARLAELCDAGFEVPPGIVVSARWCEEQAGRGAGEIRECAAELVGEAIEELGPGPFAVRSSGVGEDTEVESMAGQYRTDLHVSAEDVPAAIVRCIEATPHHSRGDGEGSMAVLIQPMVEADCAGVAFSRDPVTGDDVGVVSAVEGLAEELVAGEREGEDWRIGDGTVEGPKNEDSVLSEDRAVAIAERVETIAAEFGRPQDVEWAWADGELRILQARPITALPEPPPEEPVPDGTWVKDVSHYPNGLTPLGASTFAPAIENASAHAFERWGLMVERAEQLVHRHEVYVRMVPAGGGGGAPPPAFVLGLLARVIPSMRRRIKKARRAVEENLSEHLLERWEQEDREYFAKQTRRLREKERRTLGDEAAIEHLDECVALLHEGQKTHFMLFPPYVMAVHELVQFTEEHLGWDVHRTLDLMVGLSEETSGPARELRALGREVGEDEKVRAVLEDRTIDDSEVVEHLREVEASFATRWEAFVDRWGHRTLGYDPGEPTLAERPGIIRRRVLEFSDGGGDELERLAERRREIERAARNQLGEGELLEEFDALLDRAREVWPTREENVAYTDSMTNAVVRYAALEIGRRLANRGQVEEPEDAAMLSRDELVEGLRNGSDLRDTVRRRRAERAWVAAHPGPPVLNGPDHPPPDLRWCPEAVRKTSGALLWMASFEYDASEQEGDDAGLQGQGGAPGCARGTVRIVDGPEDFDRVEPGDVMVCPTTTPAWTVVFPNLAGIVTEGGGVLSHSAIAAREHHIPAVIGVPDAREHLEDGEVVELDGTRGTVEEVA